MSDEAFLEAAKGVADTSYSCAIEHVLTMAKDGKAASTAPRCSACAS